jgi:hypothetical protein
MIPMAPKLVEANVNFAALDIVLPLRSEVVW